MHKNIQVLNLKRFKCRYRIKRCVTPHYTRNVIYFHGTSYGLTPLK